jgi:hypothetical protein
MTVDAPAAPSLLDLIGRVWTLPGPVAEAVFNADGGAVAFVGADGLAIAPVADPERAESRMRRAADTGRQTILPRRNPARPMVEVDGARGPVAPWGAKSFIAAGRRGGLVSVTPRGQVVPLPLGLDAAPAALARDPASAAIAVSCGGAVVLLPDDASVAPRRLDAGAPVTALAYAPDGRRLAVAHDDGLAVWDADTGAAALQVALEGRPARLAWSPDGAFLAIGFAEPGVAILRLADRFVDHNPDYPTPVASLAWSRPAGAFATSGAFRAIVWTLTPDGLGDPVEAGRAGLIVADRVAASPDRPLLAVGYANGLVCLNRIGAREEMMLRPSGAAITALAWSADGVALAFGDAAGEAGLIGFPSGLFK